MDVTTLKILAKMANGEEGQNIRFQFVSSNSNEVICSSSTLEELYECVIKIDPDVLHKHVCASEDSEETNNAKDLAFYVHYVFGDIELSMKLYSAAERFQDDPEKLKLEIGNLFFTRLLNYSEIALIPD
ncbi:MAG: hypothetical protein KAS47_04855 [Candidatus Heimdallarchaeota archaeon]|nr:hypothetical protein [Candidatus Heimdallarchaeota archaeon]MCK4971888.1 hypothetical protein [Candidatus Heimdallarchaeota archaeon]